MNRWGVRAIGILLLLIFALVFLQLYKQLTDLQRTSSRPAATQTR